MGLKLCTRALMSMWMVRTFFFKSPGGGGDGVAIPNRTVAEIATVTFYFVLYRHTDNSDTYTSVAGCIQQL